MFNMAGKKEVKLPRRHRRSSSPSMHIMLDDVEDISDVDKEDAVTPTTSREHGKFGFYMNFADEDSDIHKTKIQEGSTRFGIAEGNDTNELNIQKGDMIKYAMELQKPTAQAPVLPVDVVQMQVAHGKEVKLPRRHRRSSSPSMHIMLDDVEDRSDLDKEDAVTPTTSREHGKSGFYMNFADEDSDIHKTKIKQGSTRFDIAEGNDTNELNIQKGDMIKYAVELQNATAQAPVLPVDVIQMQVAHGKEVKLPRRHRRSSSPSMHIMLDDVEDTPDLEKEDAVTPTTSREHGQVGLYMNFTDEDSDIHKTKIKEGSIRRRASSPSMHMMLDMADEE